MTSKQKEEILYSYLAGMIDADGWVTMTRRGGARSHLRSPVIGVGLTDKKITLWAKKVFGGTVCSQKQPRNKKWKPLHTWAVHGRRAVDLLKKVSPYMIHRLKSKRAKLIVKSYEEISGKGEEREYLKEKRIKLSTKVMSIQMRGV